MMVKYSDPVWAYVPKPIKARLVRLRTIDPRRFSESRIVEELLERHLEEFEAKADLSFSGPAQGAPGPKRRRRAA